MKGKRVLSVLLIIAMLFLVNGCDKKSALKKGAENLKESKTAVKEEKPQYGGELVVPITTIKTLNPLLTENISYYHFSKLIFEGLFEFDQNLNIKNVLAEDYFIMDGGRVIEISLREDVKWHDGKDFTAEDVKFTIDTIKNGNKEVSYKNLILSGVKPFGGSSINSILNVEILNAHKLKIIFDKSYSNALEMLTFPIIQKNAFNRGKKESETIEGDDYIPIGTGPYKFSGYEKLKSIKLVANDEWWKGNTYIENIIGKVVEDRELAITAFETGQVDLVIGTNIEWEKYAHNKNEYEFVSQNYEFLAFNFSKNIFNNEKGLAIRKAIAYGLDRQSIIENVYLGHATKVDVPVHPDSWLKAENINAFRYNPDKARKILEKAGWSDKDGDGIYEDENGKKLSIKLTTNFYNILRLKTANMIVADLEKIGIQVIKDYDEYTPENVNEEMMEKHWETFNNKIKRGDFDIALLGWKMSSIPELSFAFHSSQISGGTNFIKYKNEKMDQLLFKTFTFPNRDQKKANYKELELEIAKDLPYVSLFFKNDSLIIDKKVKGNINPQFHNIFYNIEEWYIPKKQNSK